MKTNQARDPLGLIGEIFKPNIVGNELKYALLELMNGIKFNMFIPENLQLANITSIFKNKGSRLNLDNDRGIFVLTIFRKILDKLTYLDKYPELDSRMSDSNIGARKNRNIRNHLFVIYAIINSVTNGDMKSIDVQIFDLEKAFDALWLEDCLNDMYDTINEESRDDKLALVYKTNVSNLVSINTPFGITSRVQIPKIVQQGGGWGPMECSLSVDTIGRRCKDRGIHQYKYKNTVNVLPLAMVDDILAINECGNKSLLMNTFIDTHITMKKLKFHTPDQSGKSKCHKLYI